jgi:putative transposase
MDYSAPQIAGRDEPFRSAIREHLKGHAQGLEDLAIEMLARGLSVRDIEDAFKDETGRLLLSKTAVSQLGERLWEDYRAFTQRDLIIRSLRRRGREASVVSSAPAHSRFLG